jgi:Flp pilus assembly protein TadG
MSLMVRHLRGRKGQALAEFALILPVLFLLIAGIIEFGRAWNIKQVLTDASREGARYAVVQDKTMTIAGVQAKVNQRLALANISGATVSVTPAANFHAANSTMTVRVSAQYRMGWVGALLKWAGGSNTITISSTTTMRNEY